MDFHTRYVKVNLYPKEIVWRFSQLLFMWFIEIYCIILCSWPLYKLFCKYSYIHSICSNWYFQNVFLVVYHSCVTGLIKKFKNVDTFFFVFLFRLCFSFYFRSRSAPWEIQLGIRIEQFIGHNTILFLFFYFSHSLCYCCMAKLFNCSSGGLIQVDIF